MILTAKDLAEITHGYEQIRETHAGITFDRFTEREYALYADNAALFPRMHNPAGIKMYFKTDATAIGLDISIGAGTDRHFFALDIYSNDNFVGSVKNYQDETMTGAYSERNGAAVFCPSGDFTHTFALEGGEKEIKIFLPWSLPTYIKRLELVNATYCIPMHYDKRMLIYGDSITHGYDAANPSMAYSVKLAEGLGAQCHIKAIGGDVFRPTTAEAGPDRAYDYITIGYGTNDYGHHPSKEAFDESAERFIGIISEKYPDSKIFVITPIWRKNCPERTKVGTMEYIHGKLKAISNSLPNVTCIYGWDLVPHDENLYGDLWLHPSNAGFTHYAEHLLCEIYKHL